MNWPAAAFLSLALAASVGAGVSNNECLSCHDQEGNSFKTSVHQSISCTDCHTSKRGYPHQANGAKVACNTCHADKVSDFQDSVHAKTGTVNCTSCHGGVHSILSKTDPKSPIYAINLPKTCGTCHGNAELAKRNGIQEVYSLYKDSIHGSALTKDGLLVAANCSSCHGSHKILSHKDMNSRTNHVNVASTCGGCHAGPQQAYLAGMHGQLMSAGVSGAPTCTDCHTAHQIAQPRTVAWAMKTTATCGNCHTDRYSTYHDTFHAQVSELGFQRTARCWDCHGPHDVRPSSDPASMTAKANLVKTCGQCHQDANASFVTYQPHADPKDAKAFPLLHVASIFMTCLLFGTIGFFALHSLLWFIRVRFDRGRATTVPRPQEGD